MTRTLQVHVGEDLAVVFDRTVAAVRRFEQGETVDEDHLSFESWDALARVLNGRRLALLRLIHKNGTSDPDALAAAIGGDRSDVMEDVEALKAAGLIEEDEQSRLLTGYDEIRTVIAL